MRNMPLAIWALVIASFAMGADEFIVAGVVQDIAHALGTTIGAVGLFESAYAIGVAIGAPLFAVFAGKASRRTMLLISAGVFLFGNVISLVGPDYGWIMTGRIVAALAHGAFFGIAAVFAAELVAPKLKGRAVATVFAGATAATILGAPIGAAVGKALGWRATFGTLVVFGAIALVGLVTLLPKGIGRAKVREVTPGGHQHHQHDPGEDEAELDAHAKMHMGSGGSISAPLKDQLRALRRPAVLIGLVTTLLGYGGVFTSYVYLAPQITEATGLSDAWVTPMFLLFGVGLFIGNQLGGKFADRNVRGALIGTVASLTVMLFAMTLLIQHPVTAVVGVLLYGIAAFSVVAPLQLRVMTKAGDAPDVASAANISAFTLGSALGIWLGGLAIDSGLGVASVNWIGGIISGAGLLFAVSSLWLDRIIPAQPFEEQPVAVAHHH
ncbi:MFS transporter, DHA1 family, inner membrane transport protein [Amycolatopsis marina]|uniref:MFS transporter, DHA1 family, inner membrane transport protein n=1 Tax=Amycolatopsis marina TaxID=490629 RepID=A0A1I1C744_9PSEU|nr:MFS transporter [Amycolatopsis marina]SFB56580.1 MFS transporter, DHA1 family, inner membrane transport protein [Amycolatopsis marina]